ncbi:MAG: hypothetical protein IT379_27890 [Deltaproteobacteria bacterium]|nr:hypothetical protein [Deltaproteobacteria bacterium]
MQGAQVCNADGTGYGACVCTPGLDAAVPPTSMDGATPEAATESDSGSDAGSTPDGSVSVDASADSSGPDAGPCISLVMPPPPDDPDCYRLWGGFSAVNTLGAGCPPLFEQRCLIAEACCQTSDSCALHRFSPNGVACVPRGYSFCDSPDHPGSCPIGDVCTPSGCCPEGRTCHSCPTPEPMVPPDLGVAVVVPPAGTGPEPGLRLGFTRDGLRNSAAMVGEDLHAYYGIYQHARYQWDTNTWAIDDAPPVSTTSTATLGVGSNVLIVATNASSGALLAFMHDPVAGTLTPRSTVGALALGGVQNVLWDGRYALMLSFAPGVSQRYEVATDTWTPMSTDAAFASGSRFFGFVSAGPTVFALWTPSSPTEDELAIFASEYDAATDRWTRRADLRVPHRPGELYSIVAAMIDGALHVLESREGFGLFRYDRAGDRWDRVSTVPRGLERPGVPYFVAGAYDGRLALLGEYFYEPATGRWARAAGRESANEALTWMGHGHFFRCSEHAGCARITPPDSLPNYCP